MHRLYRSKAESDLRLGTEAGLLTFLVKRKGLMLSVTVTSLTISKLETSRSVWAAYRNDSMFGLVVAS